MNMFRKKWPVVGAFLHLVILPVPSLTKSCDLSTSGGCKDKMNKMRAYNPNKVVGPTIFYGASRNFGRKMKAFWTKIFQLGGQKVPILSWKVNRFVASQKPWERSLGQVSPFA